VWLPRIAATLLIVTTGGAAGAAPGDLDPAFGVAGKVVTPGVLSSAAGVAPALIIQPDGKIVAVGSYGNLGFTSIRYLPDGKLDLTFGRSGIVTSTFGNEMEWADAAVLQPDGRLVVGGTSCKVVGSDLHEKSSTCRFALVRYLSDGMPDSEFGRGGEVIGDFDSRNGAVSIAREQLYGLALQPDGGIIAAGSSFDFLDHSVFLVQRYLPDGTTDPSFGESGRIETDFGATDSSTSAFDVGVLDGQRILAVGTSNLGFSLARYETNGTLDSSFGAGGVVTTPSDSFIAWSFGIEPDGKIVVGGSNLLVRYLPDGALDSSFGTSGMVTTGISVNNDPIAVTVQKDGKIVLVGDTAVPITVGCCSQFAVARYTVAGDPDATFGAQGEVTTAFAANGNAGAHAVAIQPDGRIVVAGGIETSFALARYLPGELPIFPRLSPVTRQRRGAPGRLKVVAPVSPEPSQVSGSPIGVSPTDSQ
jgi:uncharacterized delta-60 repeat protein